MLNDMPNVKPFDPTEPVVPAVDARPAPGPRTVHLAMASTVQAAGIDVARAIYAKAAQFNAEHFDGQLTALLVEITAPASPRAFATHQPRTPEGVDCVIRIGPTVVAEGPLLWEDVLLHEMIHVWQAETGLSEPGYQGHGPHFASKCNEIGARLGLPPVGVKGRAATKGGPKLPDCAQWPLNVRPAGYYPEGGRGARAAAPKKSRQRPPSLGTHPSDPTPASEPQDRVQAALALVAAMAPAERRAFLDGLDLGLDDAPAPAPEPDDLVAEPWPMRPLTQNGCAGWDSFAS